MTTETASVEHLACPRASWEDLRFPATAINPPGTVNDPDFDTTKGGWLFSPSATEVLFIVAQMPHSWIEGTEIRPHVHWEKTTSAEGDVYWNLNYQLSEIGTARQAAVDLSSATATVASDTADVHQLTTFGAIDMTGFTLSCILVMQLSRVGGNAADTYGADARLLEFDFHYQYGSAGSRQEFVK